MEIHKPRAAHSWREFAIEIGTIICGILIALALEQAVEWAHARHQADQLDRALKLEVARDLGEALQQASLFYCVRAQTATAIDRLTRSTAWPGAQPLRSGLSRSDFDKMVYAAPAAADATVIPDAPPARLEGYAPGRGAPVLIPAPRSNLSDRAWLAAASSPGLEHMDRSRRDRYAHIYQTIERFKALLEDGNVARTELAALAFRQDLTAAERRRYTQALARLDADNNGEYAATSSLVAFAAGNGIRPDEQDVRERFAQLSENWSGCLRPFVMPERERFWADKFEQDERRLGGATE